MGNFALYLTLFFLCIHTIHTNSRTQLKDETMQFSAITIYLKKLREKYLKKTNEQKREQLNKFK